MLQMGHVHGAGDEKQTLSTAYLGERCDREGQSQSAPAAIAKCSMTGRLNQQTFISHSSGSCKSEISVLAWLDFW